MKAGEEKLTAFLFGTNLKELKKIYSQVVIDHLVNPEHWGILGDANSSVKLTGPCGDTMYISIKVRDERITRCTFDTDGCIASVVCGDIVSELVEGSDIKEAMEINQDTILKFCGGLPEEDKHCALLASDTLKKAIKNYLKSN